MLPATRKRNSGFARAASYMRRMLSVICAAVRDRLAPGRVTVGSAYERPSVPSCRPSPCPFTFQAPFHPAGLSEYPSSRHTLPVRLKLAYPADPAPWNPCRLLPNTKTSFGASSVTRSPYPVAVDAISPAGAETACVFSKTSRIACDPEGWSSRVPIPAKLGVSVGVSSTTYSDPFHVCHLPVG